MERISIDKVLLDSVTMSEAVARISTMLGESRDRAAHVVTMNAQFVQMAHQEARFADVLRRADLSVADGLSVVWASRWLGKTITQAPITNTEKLSNSTPNMPWHTMPSVFYMKLRTTLHRLSVTLQAT